jgi:hypothetical protein
MSELIIEQIDFSEITQEVIEEQEGLQKVKRFYFSGPMLVAEMLNGNKRMYPKPVIESNVDKYQKAILERQSVGECEHPTTSSINMERISHLVTELKMDGNVAYGKARILDKMPLGSILRNLMDEGVKIGVSSRGTGTLRNGIVQNDYNMVAIDSVFNPSGPNCYVTGLMEGKEWVLANGVLTEQEVGIAKEEVETIVVENKFSTADKEAAFMKLFHDMLNKIKTK